MRTFYFALAALLYLATACTGADAELTDRSDLIAPQKIACDTCRYPIIMAHGFLASGDTYAAFQQLFTSNGYRGDEVFAFDWNSLNQTANHVAALNAFIDQILQKTGAPKVRLMGHSAGGGLGYNFLNDPARAAKVDGYVHIGSSAQSGPAGPGGSVPTLNIWSPDDKIVAGGNINGAVNVKLDGKDHYEVATCKEAFAAVYHFFHNKAPENLSPVFQPIVCIGGKTLTFGENTPLNNARVDIYQLDPATGQRLSPDPFETWFSNSEGIWGPTNVPADTHFEFVLTPPGANPRVIHYFREPFTHLNVMVYLRAIPPPTSLAGLLLAGLPNSANQSVLNVFSSSKAMIYERDTLTVAGSVLTTPQFASPQKTAISYFLYDGNNNGATELTPVGLFGTFSFLNGVDMHFPTTPPGSIPIQLNQRLLNVRNIPSNQGIVVAVFD